jgi:hypothetical protein
MNDIVQSGLSISNSEVGAGSLASEIMAFRVVCLNGLITPYGMRRNHVGKSLSTDESASELFSDRTREADDAAFWMKVQDTVRGSVTQASFDKVVAGMKATKAQQLGDPVAVVAICQVSACLMRSRPTPRMTISTMTVLPIWKSWAARSSS